MTHAKRSSEEASIATISQTANIIAINHIKNIERFTRTENTTSESPNNPHSAEKYIGNQASAKLMALNLNCDTIFHTTLALASLTRGKVIDKYYQLAP